MGKKIKLRVHKAYFVEDNQHKPFYFINVKNNNKREAITIVDINYIRFIGQTVSQKMPVINPQRPTPAVLKAGQQWETWIPVQMVQRPINEDIYNAFYVEYTKSHFKRSHKRVNVAPSGTVPGGNQDESESNGNNNLV
jgi:hypothetical protein